MIVLFRVSTHPEMFSRSLHITKDVTMLLRLAPGSTDISKDAARQGKIMSVSGLR